MYFYIEPEVSGVLGAGTIVDTSVHPPAVSKLDYLFEGWLEDDLLEAFRCYVLTEKLKEELSSSGLIGFEIDELDFSVSEQFEELYPEKKLPKFFWLKITGEAGKDDLGIASDYRLVISEKTLAILKKFSIAKADIEVFHE